MGEELNSRGCLIAGAIVQLIGEHQAGIGAAAAVRLLI
jgi:hypothetical protein